MDLYCVMGNPVAHSRSPQIHAAFAGQFGIELDYRRILTEAADFAERVTTFFAEGGHGLNVTLPFKEAACALADEATSRAAGARAANVLVFRPDGSILADNTDGLGLLAAFAEQAPGFDPKTGPVVILGAGGGARGAAAAFVEAGCPEVRIVNRTLAKAEEIATALGGTVRAYGLDQAGAAFEGANGLVNATSAGLANGGAIDVPLAATPEACVVMDMVYKPLTTPFLAGAQGLGRRTVDGLAMLIGQAIPSFEAFYGQTPPASVDVRTLAIQTLGL